MTDVPPAAGASDKLNPVREVSIFLCYRRNDGSWSAEWLYRRLNDVEYLDKDGRRCRVRAYYDKTAPGIADWKSLHFPSLQTARALLVICTPGIAKDFSRSGHPDWVYEELRWWVRHRQAAPIVVDATGEGDRWLPGLITKKWPDINRIPLIQEEAELAVRASDLEYEARIRERIVGTVRELEHRTLFEDLERSRSQEKRLKWAFGVAILLLAVATFLGYYANEKKREAVKQASIAREQARIAEERQALAAGLLFRLIDRNQNGSTSMTFILELMNETVTRKHETEFVVIVLDVLNCWGPHKPTAVFDRFLSDLDGIENEDVRSRVQMLCDNVEADRNGRARPHPCQIRRR